MPKDSRLFKIQGKKMTLQKSESILSNKEDIKSRQEEIKHSPVWGFDRSEGRRKWSPDKCSECLWLCVEQGVSREDYVKTNNTKKPTILIKDKSTPTCCQSEDAPF